jgi:hypothetical protein
LNRGKYQNIWIFIEWVWIQHLLLHIKDLMKISSFEKQLGFRKKIKAEASEIQLASCYAACFPS